jgi:hypothetical protein
MSGESMGSDARFEALKSAPLDSWIALSEDETSVVAVGASYSEAVKKSESTGVTDPNFTENATVLAFECSVNLKVPRNTLLLKCSNSPLPIR